MVKINRTLGVGTLQMYKIFRFARKMRVKKIAHRCGPHLCAMCVCVRGVLFPDGAGYEVGKLDNPQYKGCGGDDYYPVDGLDGGDVEHFAADCDDEHLAHEYD